MAKMIPMPAKKAHSFNLLPWREHNRLQRQKRILLAIFIAYALLLALSFVSAHLIYNATTTIAAQNQALAHRLTQANQQALSPASLKKLQQTVFYWKQLVNFTQKAKQRWQQWLNLLSLFSNIITNNPHTHLKQLIFTSHRVTLIGITSQASTLPALITKIQSLQMVKTTVLDHTQQVAQHWVFKLSLLLRTTRYTPLQHRIK